MKAQVLSFKQQNTGLWLQLKNQTGIIIFGVFLRLAVNCQEHCCSAERADLILWEVH